MMPVLEKMLSSCGGVMHLPEVLSRTLMYMVSFHSVVLVNTFYVNKMKTALTAYF